MGASFSSVQSPQTSGVKSGNIEDLTIPSTTASSNPTVPNLPQSSGKSGGLQGGGQMQGGAVTFPGQDGQPEMGMPNAYANTVGNANPMKRTDFGGQTGSWDNSSSPSGKGSAGSSGKGKGA